MSTYYIPNPAFSANLNKILANFAASEVTTTQFNALYGALMNSPALLAELDLAASTVNINQTLTGEGNPPPPIYDLNSIANMANPLAGAGAQFLSGVGQMQLNVSALGTNSLALGTLIYQIGHEAEHALNSDASMEGSPANLEASALTGIYNESQAPGSTAGYTSFAAAYIKANMQDEASASLAGWNAYVSYCTAAGLAVTNNGYSKFFYENGDPGTPQQPGQPLPNLIRNENGTFAINSDNENAEGVPYYYNNTVINYPANAAAEVVFAINQDIVAAKNGGSISLDLSQLNAPGSPVQTVTASTLQTALNQFYARNNDQPSATITFTDSSTGNVLSYDVGSTNTGNLTVQNPSVPTDTGTQQTTTVFNAAGENISTTITSTDSTTLTITSTTIVPDPNSSDDFKFTTTVSLPGMLNSILGTVTGTENSSGNILTAIVSGDVGTLTASDAIISYLLGSTATLVGNQDSVSGASGSNINLDGFAISVTATDSNVTLRSNSTATVVGSGNNLVESNSSSVTLGGAIVGVADNFNATITSTGSGSITGGLSSPSFTGDSVSWSSANGTLYSFLPSNSNPSQGTMTCQR